MRLGAEPVEVVEGTLAHAAYGETLIYERHRHRYEVNNHLRPQLEAAGLGSRASSPPRTWSRSSSCRTTLVRRLPVPPRVQVAAHQAAAAVPGLRGGGDRGAAALGRARRAGAAGRAGRGAGGRDHVALTGGGRAASHRRSRRQRWTVAGLGGRARPKGRGSARVAVMRSRGGAGGEGVLDAFPDLGLGVGAGARALRCLGRGFRAARWRSRARRRGWVRHPWACHRRERVVRSRVLRVGSGTRGWRGVRTATRAPRGRGPGWWSSAGAVHADGANGLLGGDATGLVQGGAADHTPTLRSGGGMCGCRCHAGARWFAPPLLVLGLKGGAGNCNRVRDPIARPARGETQPFSRPQL